MDTLLIDLGALTPLIVTDALGVMVTVQGLKIYGLVNEENVGKVAFGLGLGYGALFTVAEAIPAAAPYIYMVFGSIVGGSIAGIAYEYLAKPFLEKFGIAVTARDLE